MGLVWVILPLEGRMGIFTTIVVSWRSLKRLRSAETRSWSR